MCDYQNCTMCVKNDCYWCNSSCVVENICNFKDCPDNTDIQGWLLISAILMIILICIPTVCVVGVAYICLRVKIPITSEKESSEKENPIIVQMTTIECN